MTPRIVLAGDSRGLWLERWALVIVVVVGVQFFILVGHWLWCLEAFLWRMVM